MMIPPLAPAERQDNGPVFEPKSVTLIFEELIRAAYVISVIFFGQTRRDA
jgi:hypothetical protein